MWRQSASDLALSPNQSILISIKRVRVAALLSGLTALDAPLPRHEPTSFLEDPVTDTAALDAAQDSSPDPGGERPVRRYAFAPAVRTRQPARIALGGPKGALLTRTALHLATALGERTALIDTRRGQSAAYADQFAFDTVSITSFSAETLVELMAQCTEAGYPTVVIDDISAFWSGPGGILDQVDIAALRGNSSSSGWRAVRPKQRLLADVVSDYPGHVISIVRAKTEIVIETDDTGRVAPRTVALKWDQREHFEQECSLTASMDPLGTLVVTSAPTDELHGIVFSDPGAEFAAAVKAVFDQGQDPQPTDELIAWAVDRAFDPYATFDELGQVMQRVREAHLEGRALFAPDGKAHLLGQLLLNRGTELAPRNSR